MDSKEKAEVFLTVVQANKGIVYKVANSYCRDAEDRKDLIQEIVVQLWKSFDNYNDQYKYSTWIYRIALNVAISFYRKESRRKELSSPIPGDILYFDESHATAETEKNIGYLQQFIAELKELDKALMLLYLEEKSQREIADITGLTETNVSRRIGRIKKILKQKFSTIQS